MTSFDETVIDIVTQILIRRFQQSGPDNFNLAEQLANQKDPISDRELSEGEKGEIEKRLLNKINYKKAHDGATLIPVSKVVNPRDHEEWYPEWLSENKDETGSYYWKRLEHHLEYVLTAKYGPERAGAVVRAIDAATHDIMERLADPRRKKFSYKGLVVGHVQSGKTANFTALIAKAADAGYRFIIVLAGIHNVLREQTQVRLDKELTGINDWQLDEPFIQPPSEAKNWNRMTTGNNDFSSDNLAPFDHYCQRVTPTLAVIKKNCFVLNRLIEYLEQSDPVTRSKMPILIIDDEADQASIDTKANTPDTDPTRTNERIRHILRLFSQKVYIGYTATPFANLLIDMTTEHGQLEDDLYPRNFVFALPRPEGYFGTSAIFKDALAGYFVNQIPDERSTILLNGIATDNLCRAIDEFIISCSVRNNRGDRDKPMSMLIHISHKITDMTIVRGVTESYIKTLRGRINDPTGTGKIKNEYQQVWQKMSEKASVINRELGLDNFIPEFEQIWVEVLRVVPVINIAELNSSSDDELNYTSGREVKVIAIGGNQLSRGLTLEGLMTSYYLRESRQYDTLLQMARWFGYRYGYEDLTSVFTTRIIWEFFEHLAQVEEELRNEISRYEDEDKTPAQLALAIRAHRRLKVTAPNKIGAGHLRQVSFSESLNQTTWFPLSSPATLTHNLDLGARFVSRIDSEMGFEEIEKGMFLAREVPGEIVLREFMHNYHFAEKEDTGGPSLDVDELLGYIVRRMESLNPELQHWNILLAGNNKPTAEIPAINYGGITVNPVQRNRKLTESGYYIGILSEPDHLNIDIPYDKRNPLDPQDPFYGRSPQNPLLILYVISQNSRAKQYVIHPVNGQRIDLYRFVDSEKVDVLGFALVLPKSNFEPNDYIGQ
jgi:hypothetical protein